jgi:hypothetical protein
VQWRCAWLIGTGERSNGEPLRVNHIISLWASNSVPMPAVGEPNVRAGTTDIASDATSTSSFGGCRVSSAISSTANGPGRATTDILDPSTNKWIWFHDE